MQVSDTQLAEQLAQCQAADLIRLVQKEPELEYWFRHGLIQDALYSSLLRATRAQIHGHVAGAIEKQSASDQQNALAPILALHYELAGLDEKAFRYAVLAGNRARNTHAHAEALVFYGKALAVAHRLNEPRLARDVQAVYVNRGSVLEVMSDRAGAQANYREMLAFAERAGELSMQADALNHLVTVQVVPGTDREAPELKANLEKALGLARQAGDPVLIGRALWNFGLSLRFYDPLHALDYYQQALDLAQATDRFNAGARELAANTLTDLVVSLMTTGRFRQAKAYCRQAAEAFRAIDNQPMLADALGGLAIVLYNGGKPDEARASATEGARISQAIGNPWGVTYNTWSILEIETDAGRFEQALTDAENQIAAARTVGFPVFNGMALKQLARIRLELGQFKLAQVLSEESALAFEKVHAPTWSTTGQGVVAGVLLKLGELDRARALVDPLWSEGDNPVASFMGLMMAAPAITELALAQGRWDDGLAFSGWMLARLEQEEVLRYAGELRYLRGRIHLARGDLPHAEADLLLAREWLAQAEVKILLWSVDYTLAKVYAARGEATLATDTHHRAQELVRRLADGIGDLTLRRSFLGRADVGAVLDTLEGSTPLSKSSAATRKRGRAVKQREQPGP